MKDIDELGVDLAAFGPRIEAYGVRLGQLKVRRIDSVISSWAPQAYPVYTGAFDAVGCDRIYVFNVAKTKDLLTRRGLV